MERAPESGPEAEGSRLVKTAPEEGTGLKFEPLALGQGLYYATTGIWPLLSMGTFEKVTGPKKDDWLVKTVGVLVTAIGGVLTVAALRKKATPEMGLLAAGSAAGLAAIDANYSLKGRISKIYLLDALAEGALIAAWAKAARDDPRLRGRPS